ncbi:MAG: flagellar hook-basal body complex protein, partial [Allgaiera sp.]|nr:flagellar hook-basal body complex protein [Allgaiera sp.]
AIDGQGYFAITMPDGSLAYTRAGNFQVSATGQIVNLEGYQVVPGITIPANTTKVDISQQGIVQAYVGNNNTPVQLGQITMATFINEAGMKPIGNNLLKATAASGSPVTANPGDPGVGVLRQGYIESSNVNIIQQITDLIAAQRAYEMNSKAIQTADQMMSSTSQIK